MEEHINIKLSPIERILILKAGKSPKQVAKALEKHFGRPYTVHQVSGFRGRLTKKLALPDKQGSNGGIA